MEGIINILESNLVVGFLLLGFIVPLYVKLGIFDKFFGKKNGNEEIKEKLESLETNHIHELKDALERIERRLERLDDISENIAFIKAKINGYK